MRRSQRVYGATNTVQDRCQWCRVHRMRAIECARPQARQSADLAEGGNRKGHIGYRSCGVRRPRN